MPTVKCANCKRQVKLNETIIFARAAKVVHEIKSKTTSFSLLLSKGGSGSFLYIVFPETNLSENTALRQNMTEMMDELTRLRAILEVFSGSVLTTFSGGEGRKVSPAFHVSGGIIKIIIQLTSVGEMGSFFIELYKIGEFVPDWDMLTQHAGVYENYFILLEPGDYYLEVSSANFEWQVTVEAYG